jgi:release factor glutamine methyltransferase
LSAVADALRDATARLEAAGCDTPRLDAEVLLAAALGVDRASLITGDHQVPGRFEDLVARREAREPVAYITGRRWFRNLEIDVDSRVLIPRPETEHLVEAALTLPEGARVVDVGTGSGAIALALKDERPDLEVVGTDVSDAALAVARLNGSRLKLDVRWGQADWLGAVPGRIDAVVSNPPYIRDDEPLAPEIVEYEPALALYAGRDGLGAYRRLIPEVAARGVGFCALEIGEGQGDAVEALLRDAGFSSVERVADLAGIERVVVARA